MVSSPAALADLAPLDAYLPLSEEEALLVASSLAAHSPLSVEEALLVVSSPVAPEAATSLVMTSDEGLHRISQTDQKNAIEYLSPYDGVLAEVTAFAPWIAGELEEE